MATLQAKRIKDALQKVRRVGRIEEPVTIAGCDITFQNLSPDEFEAVLNEIDGLEDVAYAHAYQMEQISRSVVEIDGQNLRDVDLIEDDVPVGQFLLEVVLPNKAMADSVALKLREMKLTATVTQQPEGGTKTVRSERHQWLKDNVLKTWGREALTVAWRKFTELTIKAEDVAKKNVEFIIPDETAEDKFRRLLNELREVEDEMPDDLVNRILRDAGLLKKSSREELDAVNESLREVGPGADQLEQVAEPEVQPEPVQVPQVTPPPPPVQHALPAGPPGVPPDVQQAMASRQRLNDQNVNIPVPAPPPGTVSAAPRPQVPRQIRQAAMQNTQGVQPQGAGINTRPARTNEIAALESQLDPSIAESAPMPLRPHQAEVPELSRPIQGVDGKELMGIVNRPPMVGRNPKFRPPQR